MLSTDRRKQYAWGLIGLLTAFLIVVSVYAIQATQEAAARVESCTTPDGHCFKQQERERRRTVHRIKLTSVAANYCTLRQATSRPGPSYEGIRSCVERKLADLEGDRLP